MSENIKKTLTFIESCILKPIIPIVLSIFVILLGSFSLLKLEIRNVPKIPANRFLIVAFTRNPTGPEEVAKISNKIEKILPSVPHILEFSSTSEKSKTRIRVNFKAGVSEQQASNDLRSGLGRVRLGMEVKPPQIYSQSDDDAMLVIDFYPKNLQDQLYFDNLAMFLKNVFTPNLKKIEGVGNIDMRGYSKPYFALELDLYKMAQLGIRPHEVDHAINKETKVSNFAPVTTDTKTFALSSPNSIDNKTLLENIVVDSRRGVRIKDICKVVIKQKEYTSVSLLNGTTQTIKLYVYKTSEGNPLFINQQVQKLLKEFVKRDTNYKIKNNYERSEVIFSKTKRTFVEAVILLFIVLIFFLGSIRILVLPLIAIPLSILGTFIFMWQLGLSINEITLMAFLLSIGLLVDDAILVIERIERDRHKYGSEHFTDEVIINATLDIYKPVLVMTATLFCVFLPVVFLPGEMGYTLREFALTISISVGWSCFFSLALTPMMCKYFMRSYKPFAWTEKWLSLLEAYYQRILKFLFAYRKTVLWTTLIVTIGSLLLFTNIKSEYYPKIKTDNFSLYTNGLQNYRREYLMKEAEKIRAVLAKYEDMEHFYIDVSNGEIEIAGRTKPGRKEIILPQIKEDLKKHISYINFLSYGNDEDNLYFEMVFSSYNSPNVIQEASYEFMEALDKSNLIKEYIFIRNSSYSYSLEINREKCRAKNINPDEVRNIIEFLLQSTRMSGSVLAEDSNKYRIIVNNSSHLSTNIQKLRSYPWTISNHHHQKQVITLHDLVTIKPSIAMNSIEKYNGLNCKYVKVICKDKVTAGEIYKVIRRLQKEKLQKDIYIDFVGSLKTYEQNSGQILYIFIACILCIFLILALQFNSFMTSGLVMLTVPLAFSGAIIVLYFYGSINIYSTIGAVTLVALITKHGILFMGKEGDVIQMATERLRPVLMTTVAMILGNVPLLLYKEEAMAPLKQMAYVIVPGLLYGTLMVLLIFPIIVSFRKTSN